MHHNTHMLREMYVPKKESKEEGGRETQREKRRFGFPQPNVFKGKDKE